MASNVYHANVNVNGGGYTPNGYIPNGNHVPAMNGHNNHSNSNNNNNNKNGSSLDSPSNLPNNALHMMRQTQASKLLLNLDKYKNAVNDENGGVVDVDKPTPINLAEERVDLVDCKKELSFNQRDMEKQIERDRELMQQLSAVIRPASRRNFELEKNLMVLDKQIQLLIQNMISLQELNDLAGGVFTIDAPAAGQRKSPLLGKKKLYEQLFHILQKEPKYFASLAKHVRAREVSDYVKTVVFDMYGDQYDSREERLLLTLFQMVLQQSFDEAQDIGSQLRANNAITQMLSAYARRGQGLGILRDILEKPIREMVNQTSLNLEINPVEVYKQIINSYEAKMNKGWDSVRNPTSDEAAENKYVKRLIPPRVKQLEYIAEHFVQRIIETVDSVPFGIRWICRQLAEMAQQRFPDADRYQIGGLVGGYIYLRFFNPVVVTPESVHFVDKKLTKTMRRNLILVAKILQNLSNGVEFRDKYMHKLSKFVEKHREDIQQYFARLIDVDTLKDRMDVDNLLEHARRRECTIQISFNQIFLIHRLLYKHRKEWNPDNNLDDPVFKKLAQLGPAPENVKHSENHSINMRLSGDDDDATEAAADGDDDDDEEKAAQNNPQQQPQHHLHSHTPVQSIFVTSKDPFVNTIRTRIKSVLLNESIPQMFLDQYRNSLKAFLYHVRDWARNHNNIKVLTDTEAAISGVNKYTTQQGGEVNDSAAFNNFLVSYVNEIREMKRRADRFHYKVLAVAKARETILDHANYLQTKLTYYQQYLDNVKNNHMGDSRGANDSGKGGKSSKNGKHSEYGKPVKFGHKDLVKQSVIMDVDEEVLKQTKINFNNLVYYFSQIGPDEFEVEVKYRVGFGAKISPFPEPFRLSLSELLEMRDAHNPRFQLEMVTLNVNLLINLLNRSFVKK
eukprot:CAMPEP_0202708610 /NCGR_PEP_ID=MMETSP1385-20130828/20774_1 /ASSEMBLY_ACC=CAM_ASM_000861 /TAXON_ID=933848 /ORGANISM="Elphidium margaritaceum" /LENGTH=902 /DNA_ID=CAMNT_0049367625 /DNA_START=42 /DNA_END=2750 /DNA_ORIENTATION=+